MSVQLDLLRHGVTERGGGLRGSLDDDLTAEGWAQMHAAVALGGPWQALVSSPLRRCAAFAEQLAARLELPLQLEADLRELHFGAWEGRSTADLMQDQAEELGRFWADPYTFTPPDGEPLQCFEARIDAALQRLRQNHGGRRVLLIGHGGVIRLLLARARGLPRSQLLAVEVAHASLHGLTLGAGSSALHERSLNGEG
jgi:alpha-ribazole phosphatase